MGKIRTINMISRATIVYYGRVMGLPSVSWQKDLTYVAAIQCRRSTTRTMVSRLNLTDAFPFLFQGLLQRSVHLFIQQVVTSDGKAFEGDIALVTLPLGVLKEGYAHGHSFAPSTSYVHLFCSKEWWNSFPLYRVGR